MLTNLSKLKKLNFCNRQTKVTNLWSGNESVRSSFIKIPWSDRTYTCIQMNWKQLLVIYVSIHITIRCKTPKGIKETRYFIRDIVSANFSICIHIWFKSLPINFNSGKLWSYINLYWNNVSGFFLKKLSHLHGIALNC